MFVCLICHPQGVKLQLGKWHATSVRGCRKLLPGKAGLVCPTEPHHRLSRVSQVAQQ